MAKATCSIDGCEKRQLARGWCSMHYQRWSKWGDPHCTLVDPGARWAWIAAAASRTDDECVDWPWACGSKGYPNYWLDGKTVNPHTLVCEIVNGRRPEGMQAAHSCGRRTCCSGAHLRWATPKENCADRIIHGTHERIGGKGEGNAMAKLREDDVLSIRQRYAAGGVTQTQLGVEYGVDQTNIGYIVRGKSWPHLT